MSGVKRESGGYQMLASAVVEQAAKDYRVALKKLKTDVKNISASKMKKDCERFFRSGWMMQLTRLDGAWLESTLRKEADYDE